MNRDYAAGAEKAAAVSAAGYMDRSGAYPLNIDEPTYTRHPPLFLRDEQNPVHMIQYDVT